MNQENMTAGIIALKNKINNLLYIDSTKSLETVKDTLYKKLNSGLHKNRRLQCAWNQNDFEFMIIEIIDDPTILNERKKYWINNFRSNDVQYGYNLELYKRPWEEERQEKSKKKTWGVNGDVRKFLYEIIKELDYNLQYSQERLEHFSNIFTVEKLNWFVDYISSPLFAKKQIKNKSDFLCENDISLVGLSRIVDYLIFPKYKNENDEFIDKEIKLRKSKVHTNYGNKHKEILFPDSVAINEYIYELNKNADENENKVNLKNSNKQKIYRVSRKQKITQKDIDEIKYIKQIYDCIDRLEKTLEKNKENISQRDLNIIKRMISKLKNDAVIIKDQIRGTIYFKRLTGGTTKFNYDMDTGYFNDKLCNGKVIHGDYVLVSENKIDFGNKRHVLELLNHYSDLKKRFCDEVNSDMWHILFDFENLIESTPFDDYLKDILIMRIDGYSNDEISNELKRKYKLEFDLDRISKFYNDTIPNMIVEQHKKNIEDWIYTYKVKGKYKTCSKCGEVKLATEKYFFKEPKGRDGLKNRCKNCSNK